jgi:hypothetical protein
MEAIKSSRDLSIGMLGEGKRIQLGIEREKGSTAYCYGRQPMMFPKNLRSHHREEIAGVMHNTLLLNHTGDDTEDAAVIRKRYGRSLN